MFIKTQKPKLSRRTFLRGAAGALIALPFLEAMTASDAAFAQAGDKPRRLVSLMLPNGIYPRHWFPTSSSADGSYTPGQTMAGVIDPIMDELIVFGGVNNVVEYYRQDYMRWGFSEAKRVSQAHGGGQVSMFSGHIAFTKQADGNHTLGGDQGNFVAGSSTLDMVAAEQFGKVTPLEAMLLRSPSSPNGGPHSRTFSWQGSRNKEPTRDLPGVFSEMFAASDPQAQAAIARNLAMKRSILDGVSQDYSSLRDKVSQADRQRIERHLDSIASVERRLSAGLECSGTEPIITVRDETFDFSTQPPDEQWIRTFTELTVLAFRCDLCRVSTGLFRRAGGTSEGSFFPWLGIDPKDPANPEMNKEDPYDHHVMSHSPGTYAEQLSKIDRWYLQQYVYVASRLKEEPEGDGNLLDNSLVIQSSDHGTGNHTWTQLPFLVAGNCAGQLRTGRFVDYSSQGGVPHNRLLETLKNTLGLPEGQFGSPHYGTEGPLDLS